MAVFRFTAMYSIIQYLSVILLVRYDSILGDYQYLLEDLGIVLLYDFALGYTRPSSTLSPKRPRGSLMHPFLIYSFLLQTGLSAAFLLLVMHLVQQQPWYNPMEQDREDAFSNDEQYAEYFETTVDFLQSCFQYIIIALVFSIGAPHRRPVYTNWAMWVATLCSTGLVLMCLFAPPESIEHMQISLTEEHTQFKVYILLFAAANLVLALAVEYSYRVIKPLQTLLKLCRCKSGYKNKFKYLIDDLERDGCWPKEEKSAEADETVAAL